MTKKFFCLKVLVITFVYLALFLQQVNFFGDHTKIILNPGRGEELITLINENREHTDYLLSSILENGCSQSVATRLEYCKIILRKLSGFGSSTHEAGDIYMVVESSD